MIIKYKNYTIEEDRNCVILTQTLISRAGKNKGEEYEAEQIFPSTTLNALKRIWDMEKSSKQNVVNLEQYISTIEKVEEEVLKGLERLSLSLTKD